MYNMSIYEFNSTTALPSDAFNQSFRGIPKSTVLVIVSAIVGVASLSFCSRSVGVAFSFFLSFVVGRAAVMCFDGATIKNAMIDFTWVSAGLGYISFLLFPPLIVESVAAFEAHDFRKHIWPIFVLGGLCYFVNFGLAGISTHLQMGVMHLLTCEHVRSIRNCGNWTSSGPIWSYKDAFKFAATISQTSPIASSILLHHIGLPQNLHMLIKGESVISCAVARFVVNVLNVTNTPIGTSSKVAPGAAIGAQIGYLAMGVVISVFIGYIVGRIAATLLRGISMDPTREIAFVVGFVYLIYGLCSLFHGSAIAGTLMFALTLHANLKWMNRAHLDARRRIWTSMAYYVNCILLVQIGLKSSIHCDWGYAVHCLVAFPLSLVCRALALILCTWLLRLVSGGRYPIQYTCFLVWSGVRGALSMLLVWRFYRPGEILSPVDAPDEQIKQDLALWMVGSTVALGHLLQGATVHWMAKVLHLAGLSRADREHLNEFVIRMNTRIKERIAIRKALPRYAEADWSKIEHNASLRLENQEGLLIDSGQAEFDNEDSEWYARDAMQRIYDVQLYGLSQFGALSRGLQRVQQAVAEATETHSRIVLRPLVKDIRTDSIWRRLLPTGGWNPPWLIRLIGERRSVWGDFWRLVCASTASVQVIDLLLTFAMNDDDRLPTAALFVSGLLALFDAFEYLLRLLKHRHRLHTTYINTKNISNWLYLITGPFHWISLGLHLYIMHECRHPTNWIFDVRTPSAPGAIRYSLLSLTAILWLNTVVVIFLVIRLVAFELGNRWQSDDEQSFDILTALKSLSTHAIDNLKEGELSTIDPAQLRRRLIAENENVQKESNEMLAQLYRRRGGAHIFSAIKTRRVAFDALYDALYFFQLAKQSGELSESEFKMALDAIDRFRVKVVQWSVDKCINPPSSSTQNEQQQKKPKMGKKKT